MTYLYGHQSEEIRALQKALAALNLYHDAIDGGFGDNTLAAVKAAQDLYGLPETGIVDTALLLELGVVTPAPPAKPANPITDFFTGLATKAILNQLLKGIPIMGLINVLGGVKSFILGGVTIIYGLCELIGWNVPELGNTPPGATIAAGLALIFLRLGINNAIAKAIEGVVTNLGK